MNVFYKYRPGKDSDHEFNVRTLSVDTAAF